MKIKERERERDTRTYIFMYREYVCESETHRRLDCLILIGSLCTMYGEHILLKWN